MSSAARRSSESEYFQQQQQQQQQRRGSSPSSPDAVRNVRNSLSQSERRGSASPGRRGSQSPSSSSAGVSESKQSSSSPGEELSYDDKQRQFKRVLLAHASEVWEKDQEIAVVQRKLASVSACLAHKQEIKRKIQEEAEAKILLERSQALSLQIPSDSSVASSRRRSQSPGRQSVAAQAVSNKYDAMRRQSLTKK